MAAGRLFGRVSVLVATILAAVTLSVGVAGAQTSDDGQGAYVGGTTVVRTPTTVAPSAPSADVLGASQSRASSAGASSRAGGAALAFTGGDVIGLMVIGVAALAVGGLMVTSRRRTLRTA